MDKEQITSGYRTQGSTPASASEGDAFFFSSPELNQRLDLLRHLTVNSERIPLVQGQAGVGKSTILRQFQSQAPDSWMLFRIDGNLMLQPEQLFSLLGKGFGVAVNDDRLIERLIVRFEDLNREGLLPVILVDDAHLLPVTTIISLLRLYERHPESHALIRLLLFASPQFDELLKTPQIQAMNLQLLQRLELPPLNQEQTEQMIQQMLCRRGFSDQLKLSRGQLEKIHRDTGGLPAEIIQQLERMLARGPAPQLLSSGHRQRSALAGISGPALTGGILVAMLLLLVLWFQDEINALFQGEAPAERLVSLPPVANEALIPLKLPEPEGPSTETEDVFLTEEAPAAAATPGVAPKLALPEVNGAEQQDSEAESVGAPEITGGRDQAPGLSEAGATELDPWSSAPDAATAVERLAEASTDQDRWSLAVQLDSMFADTLVIRGPSEASSTVAVDDHGQSLVSAEVTKSAEQGPAALVPVPPTEAEEPPVPKVTVSAQALSADGEQRLPTSEAAILTEAWLLRQDPSAYTLQLIGVQEEKAVHRFARTHRLDGPVAYFRSLRDGRAWYSVVYGIYPDRDAAAAGRSQLPAALRDTGVWPRSLASVQQAIRGN